MGEEDLDAWCEGTADGGDGKPLSKQLTKDQKEERERLYAKLMRERTIARARDQVKQQTQFVATTQDTVLKEAHMTQDEILEGQLDRYQEAHKSATSSTGAGAQACVGATKVRSKSSPRKAQRTKLVDYYARGVVRTAQPDAADEVHLEALTFHATQAGKETPNRPKPLEIWKNRKLNIKRFDQYHQGWRYKENKHLDLCPEEGYTVLSLHKKKPDILHYVNLHDELPRGMKDSRRLENGTEDNADYDIPEMWRRLQQEEPDAIKEAVIFNHGDKGRSHHARSSVGECNDNNTGEMNGRETNPSIMTNDQRLGNNSPKYNYKQQRQPGAGKGLGDVSPKSCADFMTPEDAQRAADPEARQAQKRRTMGVRPAPALPASQPGSAFGDHPAVTPLAPAFEVLTGPAT